MLPKGVPALSVSESSWNGTNSSRTEFAGRLVRLVGPGATTATKVCRPRQPEPRRTLGLRPFSAHRLSATHGKVYLTNNALRHNDIKVQNNPVIARARE